MGAHTNTHTHMNSHTHTHTHSHIHKNYLLFPVMQALLRLHRIKYNIRDSGIHDHLSAEVGQILQIGSGGVAVGGEMGGASAEADEHVCYL